MIYEVTYMSGAGNTFSVLSETALAGRELTAEVVRHLCSAGEKTEGLLAIGLGNGTTDFSARFFNPDGTCGMMCGNGGRCAVAYAENIGLIGRERVISFDLSGTVYRAQFTERGVLLAFPPARGAKQMTLQTEFGTISGTFVDVGSDHFIVDFAELMKNINPEKLETPTTFELSDPQILVQKLRNPDFDFIDFARALRHHEAFAPRGTNVNLFAEAGDCNLELRTFERGVEAETGACGTGAISTALSYGAQGREVRIVPPSRDPLFVTVLTGEILLEGSAYATGKQTFEI